MPSFQDSAVLVILALLLFGPKKLPVLARQLGKLMNDFRRASNEFRTQMEEELRISEQAERQKQVAAIETAAPATPVLVSPEPTPEPEHPHLPPPESAESASDPESQYAQESISETLPEPISEPASAPVPIATSGDLSILPPATGLPIPNSASPVESNSNHNATEPQSQETELETETLHG